MTIDEWLVGYIRELIDFAERYRRTAVEDPSYPRDQGQQAWNDDFERDQKP